MAWNRGIKLWSWKGSGPWWIFANSWELQWLGELKSKRRHALGEDQLLGQEVSGCSTQECGAKLAACREDMTPMFLPWDHKKWSGASSRLLHLLAGTEHPSSSCCTWPLSPCTPLHMSQVSQHQLCRAVVRGESGCPPTPMFPDAPH